MTTEALLQDKFVAFVDILGFESKVDSLEEGEGPGLSDLLELCSKLSQKSHVDGITEYGPVICPASRYTSRGLDYEVTQVSDCAVISAEVSPAGIINLLQHVSACVFGLLTRGVMVRGYVTRGAIYHRENQFIGKGYQHAFQKEKQVSAFRLSTDSTSTPFVEIDADVVKYIKEETDQCVREIFKRLTKEDDNGIAVVFPFYKLSNLAGQNIGDEEKCRESLKVVRKWIADFLEKLNAQSPSSDTRANSKAVYYRNFLKEQLEECDQIEELLHTLKQPAVKARFDKNLNVVWDC